MGSLWQSKINIHLLLKISLAETHTHTLTCTIAWSVTRGLLHSPPSFPWIARCLLRISTTDFLWPPDLWVSKELTYSLKFKGQRKSIYWGILFNGFLLVSLVYATEKSSLSSLDCLSSIVDRSAAWNSVLLFIVSNSIAGKVRANVFDSWALSTRSYLYSLHC